MFNSCQFLRYKGHLIINVKSCLQCILISFLLCTELLRRPVRRSKLRRSKQGLRSWCATFPSRPLSGRFESFSGTSNTSLSVSLLMICFNEFFPFCLFSTFGELKTVRLPKKAAGSGNHRGFGFVDFITKQDAKVC